MSITLNSTPATFSLVPGTPGSASQTVTLTVPSGSYASAAWGITHTIGGLPGGDSIVHLMQIPGASNDAFANETADGTYNENATVGTLNLAAVNAVAGAGGGTLTAAYVTGLLSGSSAPSSSDAVSLLTLTLNPSCGYSLAPASVVMPASASAGNSVVVTTGISCAWTATANAGWITITGGASGTGGGSVVYSLSANTGGSSRMGAITIAGDTFTVTQLGTTPQTDGVTDSGEGGVTVSSPNTCQLALTRPYMRDAIRRKLGITPMIDQIPGALPGEQPTWSIDPNNITINQAISDAIRELNRRCQFHGSVAISVAVPAVTAPGPQFIPLQGIGAGIYQNAINDVRRAVWDDGAGNLNRLAPRSYLDLDRRHGQIDMRAPGAPTEFFIEAYQIALLPGAASGGVLHLYAGMALIGFCSDTDLLDELPIDYEEVVENLAVMNLLRMRPERPTAERQMQTYAASVAQGVEDIRRWVQTINLAQQPRMSYESRRRLRRV